MNFESSEEDKMTCAHCGVAHWIDEWHLCDEAAAASREATERFDRNFKGKGRMKGRLTIDFECFDSDMALQSVVDQAISDTLHLNETAGSDEVLQFKWQSSLKRSPAS